jgi:hypothetical protein
MLNNNEALFGDRQGVAELEPLCLSRAASKTDIQIVFKLL